jgi:hypothetical protein
MLLPHLSTRPRITLHPRHTPSSRRLSTSLRHLNLYKLAILIEHEVGLAQVEAIGVAQEATVSRCIVVALEFEAAS